MNALEELVGAWPVDNVAAQLGNPEEVLIAGEQDRQYELASVTKLLAAYGFLIAVEEGVFELDTVCTPEGATVQQLLSHAGGVGFHEFDRHKPVGEKRIYSSYGFEILGEKVAQEADMPYAEYLEEAVFSPLGMTKTQLVGSPGHGAVSTAHDLGLFAREVIDPVLLSEEMLERATSIQYPELAGIVPGYGRFNPNPWGLGFEIKGEKNPHWLGSSQPPETVGHFGQAGTYLWVHRPTKRYMVALTDRPFGDWARKAWAPTNDAAWALVN